MSDDIAEAMGGEFDANSVEPASGYEPIPAGWYPVHIDNAEVLTTKAGTGKRLKLELTVLGDSHAGRKLFPSLNLVNPNPTAVEIGMRELAALALACGLRSMKSSDEVIGQTIQVRVKIDKAHDDYPADNSVTAYKPMDGAAPAAPRATAAAEPAAEAPPAQAAAAPARKPAAAAAAPAKAPAAKTKRPWER
jgi:hypothetical protein